MNPSKLLRRLASGALNNVSFADFRRLIEACGFELERIQGSHQIFRHRRVCKELVLQPLKNGDAKPYQIRQFLYLIEEYHVKVEE